MRLLRGWTQEEAAERLSSVLGHQWSATTWSAAERSAHGERVRRFDATELAALARLFDVSPLYFLTPDSVDDEVELGGERIGGAALVETLFSLDADTEQRLRDAYRWRTRDEPWTLLRRLTQRVTTAFHASEREVRAVLHEADAIRAELGERP